jgi:general secretion pathway protein D
MQVARRSNDEGLQEKRMNRKNLAAAIMLVLPLIASCASYNAYEKGLAAEKTKDWDQAVLQYQKALGVDPDNLRYKVNFQRAKLEASRNHFEKGKSLRTAAQTAANPSDALRLNQLAATELELTVKLDSTNQYAAVEYGKIVNAIQDAIRAQDKGSVDEMKKRAKNNISKAQPPTLNPASDQPISLTFPRETPVKEIYRALGNAFGINILFDQAVKDDRIAIELKDVTAQQALERVMQAANHFYKVLDEHTIIVVPDNPQARRDYEDLVIRTFYLSNGDAEQVTNVVRTMIEARNLFPLKALNAITIRDTADKVRIAEKIIEANDKAKSEVVVDVELIELDLSRNQEFGAFVTGLAGGSLSPTTVVTDTAGKTSIGPLASGTTGDLFNAIRNGHYSFNIPTVSYSFAKSLGNANTLANPELRISEGEKATLHIGQRIPVPVTTFTTGVQSGSLGSLPATSFQYQDVGIKVAIEPRVHHNREVTLKLTVEVSDVGEDVNVGGGTLVPKFTTRTIEDTIRLKDGETNFLAGLIQRSDTSTDSKTPILGDIPLLGRLFTQNKQKGTRTDLMLTMTPHIIRVPDITEDDLAPMWVGTQNNLTFRGVSPRIESQAGIDPFTPTTANQFKNLPLADGEPGNYIQPPGGMQPSTTTAPALINGAPPNDPFKKPAPTPPPNPDPQSQLRKNAPVSNSSAVETSTAVQTALMAAGMPAMLSASSLSASSSAAPSESDTASATRVNSGLTPRISPQPVHLSVKPGEMRTWSVVGMDLDGLTTNQILLHFDPRTIYVTEVSFGPAMEIDPKTPPVVTIDSTKGVIRISSSNATKPLRFASGGELAVLRVQGGLAGDTFLVLDIPDLRNGRGEVVPATVTGGRARVQ